MSDGFIKLSFGTWSEGRNGKMEREVRSEEREREIPIFLMNSLNATHY